MITADGGVHVLDPKSVGEVPAEQWEPKVWMDRKLLRDPLPAFRTGA